MHIRMTIYGTDQSTKVVNIELNTCIIYGFVFHSTLESGLDLSGELLVWNDVAFKTISPDQMSTFFTDTLFEIGTRTTSERTYFYQLTLKPRVEPLKQTGKSQIFVKINVQSLVNSHILIIKDLPTLPQCVQAQENDCTFFIRLLAKYGLIYWFECHDFNKSIVISEGNLASPYIEQGLLSVTGKDGLVHEYGTSFVGFTQCQSRLRFSMDGSQVHVNAHPPTSVRSAQCRHFEPATQKPSEQFEHTGNLELAYQQGKNEVTLVGNVADANTVYSFSLSG
ncbi:contractile injection system protein, VgrG/Pvc8 family [Pseudoalteromonas piscicida]|uniref:contractile injection system protein, VgrG/Pvc8 family n=1 Tax=Pseudoalteromonas piscicida TaxID=43662 RepID=UPI000E358ABE|nr:contractile injection system protein, VgrG/Pvc8 family [Pseudoalteromonas piscicida]AXQ97900.1 hypothetical protein D0N37_09145 [Pseudoalteromonas piscicida]